MTQSPGPLPGHMMGNSHPNQTLVPGMQTSSPISQLHQYQLRFRILSISRKGTFF